MTSVDCHTFVAVPPEASRVVAALDVAMASVASLTKPAT